VQAFLYKDAQPRETIARIRRILEELDVVVTEDAWFEHGPYLHSVRVSAGSSFFAANGKGLTREAALASAYAELMERLQNQLMHRFTYYLARHHAGAMEKPTFIHAADEVHLTIDNYVAATGRGLIEPFAPEDAAGDPSLWLQLFTEDGKLLCVPYLDLDSGERVLMPVRLTLFVHGSTGMCAGNTVSEALVQGISEVAERHALDVIYHHQLTPPELSRTSMAASPVVSSILSELEDRHGLQVSIRDCSLGQGLPVVAVLVHDRGQGRYRVAFGAHPNLDEAVARCLTEVFQGVPDDQTGFGAPVNLLRSLCEPAPGAANFKRLRHRGHGAYPAAMLQGPASYQQRLAVSPVPLNTVGALAFLRDLVADLGCGPLLVRDVSYLGFPSFHVIVPGLARRRYRLAELELHAETMAVADLLVDLDSRSSADLERARDLLERVMDSDVVLEPDLTSLSWVPLRGSSPWSGAHPLLLAAHIDLELGDWRRAAASLDRVANETLDCRQGGAPVHTMVAAVARDLLVLTRRDGLAPAAAAARLGQLYEPALVTAVQLSGSDRAGQLNLLGVPRCFRCNECELAEDCDYALWRELTSKLRREMKDGVMHLQDHLGQ